MNDTIIISTISKTYFIILSIFTFILLSLISVFIILQNGLYLDTISFKGIQVEGLYIKWNEKIDVSAKKILITPQKKKNAQKLNLKAIQASLKKLPLLRSLFQSIIIQEIKYNNLRASLFYKEGEDGYINILSDSLKIDSSLYVSHKYLQLHINKLQTLQRDILFSGDIYVDNKTFKIYTNIVAKVQKDINISCYAIVENSKIRYFLKNNKKIKSIDYLVNSFNVPKPVKFWLLDAIDMDYLSVENINGFIDFNNFDKALQNVQVKATIHKLNYMYHKNLDSIHTQTTQLEFKKGVLYIRPQKAYSYGMFLNKSWLKIDFTKKEELLTLHLLFNDGMLNKDVLNILNTYHIKLPFLQHKGKVQTKLKIKVGLRNVNIDAKGSFYTENANFDYLGLNIDVQKALIQLNNYSVTIDNMIASYKDIAKASVNVIYDAKKSQGKIKFDFSKINFADKKIKLSKEPLPVLYTIVPHNDSLYIDKSTWLINNKNLTISPIQMPFNLDSLKIKLPTTTFNSSIANGFVSGTIDLKKEIASFDLDLLSLKYKNITLKDSNTQLKVNYNKKLSLFSKHIMRFDADGLDVKISDFLLDITADNLQIHKTKIDVNNLLSTQINTDYNLSNNKNLIHLDYLNIIENNTSFYNKKNIDLEVNTSPLGTTISSPQLDTQFITEKKSWRFQTKSLDKLALNSSLLQKLKIKKGKLIVEKKSGDEAIHIKANLDYQYPFLLINDKKTKIYSINASILHNDIKIDVNDNIQIDINDAINIQASNCAIDMQELLKIKNNIQLPYTDGKSKTIFLETKNVTLQLTQTRKIISDTISMQSNNGISTLQLKYKHGIAGFKIENDTFHLYGSKFNDEFMEHLFSLSKFKGGELEFSVKGTLENFNGAFYIHNTTVTDYKLLNNILAFINTVPSLVTFSLPDYNKNGLYVQSAYAKFNSLNGLFHISDFLVDAKEIDILGEGEANFYKDTIDLTLNLKTDLGSDASKIPLVGYILFDKDSISTSMRITGKLSDPDIHSLLARDIIVAPLNILKRTILLPFKFISDIITKDKKEK